ncbi:hypothetical protein [Azospirillum sp. SYSU D00513]|uniref:hypothetical protein n=1 Tax=Azospirillum sp. SYSU D00513 TaxID=2812561 RepID=UPI001A95E77B|nr:hypothetical protein [Azospirillum sp. SYSU D00513]
MGHSHPSSSAQPDLFGEQPKPLHETMTARWDILSGDYEGQRGVLKSHFDTKEGKRLCRVILDGSREEVIVPVGDILLDMDSVFPPQRPKAQPPFDWRAALSILSNRPELRHSASA